MENKEKVLSVKDLVIHFSTDHGYVQAVRGISFDLYKGETLCIVGESGSGKSVTSKSIMGILAANGRVKGGSIMYEGEDLTKVSEDEFHRIRGHKIGMIFQDPLSSLNPIVRIGKQITEAMLVNNNRMKRLYQDKVAKELVAYKNTITERDGIIANAKDKVAFLKVDKKKAAESYLVKHQGVEAAIYAEQKLLRDKITDISSEYGEKIDALKLKINDENPANIQEEIKTLEAKMNEAVNAATNDFKAKKAEISKGKGQERKENRAAIKALKADYNKQIKEAKAEYKVICKETKPRFADEIKEKRALYLARSKEVKGEIAQYKKNNKYEYNKKRREILEKLKVAKTPHAKNSCKESLKKLKENYIASLRVTKKEAKARAIKIMKEVGIPEPEKRFKQFPFEFSGGMRQRIVIAIALTADPDILICDEPTTALDVTIQAQILELINRLKESRNLSCIFITHDLGVVANMADRVAVMYAGKIVEYGTAEDIFYNPKHPYTWALLSSIPDVDSKEKLDAIPGTPPNMIYPPKGDAFALRSKYALKIDFEKEPPFFKISDTHYAATWLLDPRAPKVKMPEIVSERIKNSLNKAKEAKEAK